MQPDYNQLWRNRNNSQMTETQFYAFFEDNLNQFISTNAGSSQPVENKNAEQHEIDSDNHNKVNFPDKQQDIL